MTKGLIARKLGMTQLFNADGTLSAVTVLEAGPCRVVGLRTVEKHGYTAAQLGFGEPRKKGLSKPAARVFRGVRMAGQMGNAKTTVQGLKVLRVDTERNLLLIGGAVPGAKGAVVMVRGSGKAARQAARKKK